MHPNIILAIIMCVFLMLCPIALWYFRTDGDKKFIGIITSTIVISVIGILVLAFHLYR